MVRLKQNTSSFAFNNAKRLNSTMVRLKQELMNKQFLSERRLNSTMVRLKQTNATGLNIDTLKSQFHYGSIKTKVYIIRINDRHESQFHYGSIKTI